jgi:hypothetical protein
MLFPQKILTRCLGLVAATLAISFSAAAADSDGLQASVATNALESPHVPAPELRSSPAAAPALPAVPAADAPDPLPQETTAPDMAPAGDAASLAANSPPDLPPPGALPPDTSTSAPSKNVTINLINLMVKRGLITKEDSEGLIQQAEEEAVAAQQTPAPSAPAPAPAEPVGDEDDVRVNYVPDVVKNQIRDDIKADVMKQARDEHWGATDNNLPDWVHRFHVNGDIRVRVEGDYFPTGNDNTGAFTNFNSINTGSPFDTSAISNPRFPPEYDVDQDRYRPRIRARIGADIDLDNNFTAGMRVGTGQDDSPTTQNQTLGLANQGQGGDFSKYAVWLDRAFIRYDLAQKQEHFTISVGRFDNPFLSSSMIWASEIGFDGVAAKESYDVNDSVTPFLTGGFFPVFNTDFNFASNQPSKFHSEDKWLEAAQLGVAWKINKDFTATAAAAIYYFDNVAGKLSDPFTPLSTADQGNTDDTRPSFAQNGNTYMELRDIVPTAANDFGTIDQFQYYGLATQFHDVAVTAEVDYHRFDPFQIQILGEFVDNVAFDANAINQIAVNNRGSGVGNFDGGNKGYNVRLTVGQPVLQKLWDWNITLTYRYVESDATIDGFTDADFGGPLVGTNLKGYIIGGYLALAPRISLALRYMSADAIAGPPYKNDLFQFDINAKF